MVLGFSLLMINYCNHFTLVIEFSHFTLVKVFAFLVIEFLIITEFCKLVLKSPFGSC